MRIGPLRQRLRIQSLTETRTDAGGVTETWADDAIVWASVRPLTGHEYLEARRVDAVVSHEVRIRYRSGLTPSHRFAFDNDTDRVLNIISMFNVDERGRELVVMCKEDV